MIPSKQKRQTKLVCLFCLLTCLSQFGVYASTKESDTFGGGQWQRIAVGYDLKENAVLASFDPTLLLNGLYEVRLSGYDRAGQSLHDTIEVVVKGGMKIGHFSLSFSDIMIRAAGLPLSVTRTYDSRDKRLGDFGIGWTLDMNNVRVQKNGVVGGTDSNQLWESVRVGGALTGYWTVRPLKPRIVTITLPDGMVYSFRARFTPEQQSFFAPDSGNIVWSPQSGTKGQLQAVGGDFVWSSNTNGLTTLSDDEGAPYDPDEFVLTLPDGRVLGVQQGVGLQWLQDASGNRVDLIRNAQNKLVRLTSTPDGAAASVKDVNIARNAAGLITSITDENGKSVLYTQDANNDLTKVTDRVGANTTFTYNAIHHLQELKDPRGIQAVRNAYDDDGRLVSTTDAQGKTIAFDHDIAGRRETVYDRANRPTVMTYDDYGNVLATTRVLDGRAITTTSEYSDTANPDQPTKVTDALGRSTTFLYDANGSPTKITDPLGHATLMTYEGTRVKTVQDASGIVVVENTYNRKQQLIASRDALGRTTQYEYYSFGLPRRTIDAQNRSTLYGVDGALNPNSVTDANGHTVTFTFDGNGNKTSQSTTRTIPGAGVQTLVSGTTYDAADRPTQSIRADGSRSYTTYNAIGQVAFTRDSLNRVTSFEYDSLGQKIGASYPDGSTTGTTYDANGNVKTSTDRAGRNTTFEYDSLDRQTKTIMADGAFTRQHYDDAGQVLESYDEKNRKTSFEYDAAGRQTKTTDALGKSSVTTYDERDRQASVKDALNKVTSFNYNNVGQLLSTTFADNTSTSSIYDELGRATQQTDQAGRSSKFGFDALGRLSSVTQVMDAVDETKNLVTTYGYDELGQKLWQQDAKGRRTEFSYDNMGRLTGRKLPGGEVEAMAYNIGGQLTGKSDFAGRITKYAYDQRGRLILKTPDASLSEPQVSFSYPNELTRVARRGSIANTYRYDPQRGWLDSVQSPNGLIEYSYDQTGNRTKVKITGKDNGVRETDYAYDELNRVDTVSRPGMGVLANYSYNAVGNVSNVARANGVLSAYGYDDLHRLTAIEHKKGTEVLSQFNYALSADGKRNTLQEYLKYPAAQSVSSVNRTVFYGYDNAGRLTGEQRQSTQALTAGGTIGRTGKTVWAYDKASNRLSQSVSNYEAIGTAGTPTSTHDTGYQYNINDWLTTSTSEYSNAGQTTTSTTNYEYNENGSQTAITSKVGETDQKRVPYFYDFEQKLVGIGAPADTRKHTYAYDAEGNRVTETNTNAGNASTRNYLVDPQNSNAQVVEEYDEAGVLQSHYDWNDAELLRQSSLNGADTEVSQPLADGHGSTRQLLNEAGTVSDVYSFDAWGNAQESVGSSVNPYRYNGQRLDASGLYHLRARQYSSGTGRFLSHDPLMGSLGNPITQHRYLYAGADPVNQVDPSGKEFNLNSSLSSLSSIGMMGARAVSSSSLVLRVAAMRAPYWILANAIRIEFYAAALSLPFVAIELAHEGSKALMENVEPFDGENAGKFMEKKLNANAAGYEGIDHHFPDDQHGVSFKTWGGGSEVDPNNLDYAENNLVKKINFYADDFVNKTKGDIAKPINTNNPLKVVTSRSMIMGIPQDLGQLLERPYVQNALRAVHERTNIAVTVAPIRNWMPKRGR